MPNPRTGNWQFDTCRPSHAFQRSARLPKRPENGPEIPAFRAFALVSRLRFAELEAEIAENLRPFSRIFPFWGDYRRRRVRSGLPPEDGSVGLSPTGRDGCWSVGTTCVQADVPLSRGDERGREAGKSLTRG